MLWHQGESDAGRDVDYFQRFNEMLETLQISAPVFVAVASRCREQPPDARLRNAQRRLGAAFCPGPDTDTLGADYRFDGCHFSDEGLARAADLWAAVLSRKDHAKPQCGM